MTLCKWCYCHDVSEYPYSWQEIDDNAMAWLGIEKDKICGFCQRHIVYTTRLIGRNFIRSYNVNLSPSGFEFVIYRDIPHWLKKIGWCAFLQDHLRDLVHGRYIKLRIAKSKGKGKG